MISPTALDIERDRAFATVGRALSLDAWPAVPVVWNRRLRRAGRAVVERRGSRIFATIELSPAYFEVYPDDLVGILVHESVHVGLALLGRSFGHSPAFRRTCLEAGGRLHSRPMPGRVWLYRCPVCGRTLERRRRPSGDRWCAPCVEDVSDKRRATYTRERALVLVGLRFSAGDAARDAPSEPNVPSDPTVLPEPTVPPEGRVIAEPSVIAEPTAVPRRRPSGAGGSLAPAAAPEVR